MLRNDREHSTARQLLIGLSAMKRGIAHLAQSYRDYAVGPSASDLIARLDADMGRLANDIEHYQVGRFSPTEEATNQAAFVLLERIPDLPQCLIEARLALNWKQCHFAEYAQLNQQQLSRYESHNYANISLLKAIVLSKVLTKEYNSRRESLAKMQNYS